MEWEGPQELEEVKNISSPTHGTVTKVSSVAHPDQLMNGHEEEEQLSESDDDDDDGSADEYVADRTKAKAMGKVCLILVLLPYIS